jgi:hypothetical protein
LTPLLAPNAAELVVRGEEEGEKARPVEGDPAKVEAAKTKTERTKAKTDADKTKAIREVLLAQTLRPDSILVGDTRFGRQTRVCMDGFTTSRLRGRLADSWKLDDLWKRRAAPTSPSSITCAGRQGASRVAGPLASCSPSRSITEPLAPADRPRE